MSSSTILKIRETHRALLRDLRPAGLATGVGVIALHFGFWAAAAYACVQLSSQSLVLAAAVYPVVWLFIGTRFRAFGNIVHECSHGIFVPQRTHNTLIGHALAFLDFTAFEVYTREHMTHHAYLGDPEKDLDYATRRTLFEPRSGRFWVRHVLRPLFLVHVPRYISPLLFRRQDSLALAVTRQSFNLGLLMFAHFVIGWPAFFLFYALPYATSYQVIRYWSDAADHAGLTSEPDEFARSRNHIFRFPLLNWLFFPRHDQFHLVHHLFPGAPTFAYPGLHRKLMAEPAYAALDHSGEGLLIRSTDTR